MSLISIMNYWVEDYYGNRKDLEMATHDVTSSNYEAEVIELLGLPRRVGYGNLVARFDSLNPGEALLAIDNRDLTWILSLVKELRTHDINHARSHAFEKPENYFLYLVKE